MAGKIFRAERSSPAITISLTALALAPGVLKTTIPRWVQASRGMLLTPAPARAMALTVAGSSISSILAERTMMASGSAISAL